jgi:ubiquinone/menaquinone biosynthesis C-methylase UbiE
MNDTANAKPERTYLPAAGHDRFLPLYDLTTKLFGTDRAKKVLLDQAELRPGQRVLDIGCGTGTFAILITRRCPQVEVIGLDPDPKALARARKKAQRFGVSVEFDQGFSDALEYPAASFDGVFSTFMFHHLEGDQKQQTLLEVRRVLKSGGFLHLLDFSGPEAAKNWLSRRLHSRHRLAENSEGRILSLMDEAGFYNAKVTSRQTVMFGAAHIVYYQASAPEIPVTSI